jgi:hypothetical protein
MMNYRPNTDVDFEAIALEARLRDVMAFMRLSGSAPRMNANGSTQVESGICTTAFMPRPPVRQAGGRA